MLGLLRASSPGTLLLATGLSRGGFARNSRKESGFSPSRSSRDRFGMLWKLRDSEHPVLDGLADSLQPHTWRPSSARKPGWPQSAFPAVWDLALNGGGDGRPDRGPAVVRFVGEPSLRRGFDLFTLAAAAMQSERLANRVHFSAHVQTDSRISGRDPHLTAFADFFSEDLPQLSLQRSDMSSEDFAKRISDCDIVWSLGDPNFYSSLGTSGMFANAMFLGRRVITNSGGWAEFETSNPAHARFSPYTVRDAVRCIRFLLAADPNDGGARSESQRWRSNHSRGAFRQFVSESLDWADRARAR